MSTKQKLMDEIARKAKRIKEKRVEAAGNKTIEAYVFEFFRQVDEANQQPVDEVRRTFLAFSTESLQSKIRSVDSKAKIEIVWLGEERKVQGVTINWSPLYIKMNNVDPSIYIDVSQMLFS